MRVRLACANRAPDLQPESIRNGSTAIEDINKLVPAEESGTGELRAFLVLPALCCVSILHYIHGADRPRACLKKSTAKCSAWTVPIPRTHHPLDGGNDWWLTSMYAISRKHSKTGYAPPVPVPCGCNDDVLMQLSQMFGPCGTSGSKWDVALGGAERLVESWSDLVEFGNDSRHVRSGPINCWMVSNAFVPELVNAVWSYSACAALQTPYYGFPFN